MIPILNLLAISMKPNQIGFTISESPSSQTKFQVGHASDWMQSITVSIQKNRISIPNIGWLNRDTLHCLKTTKMLEIFNWASKSYGLHSIIKKDENKIT